jgi:hypothetical protein
MREVCPERRGGRGVEASIYTVLAGIASRAQEGVRIEW